MATHRSAEKRNRQNEKRRARNRLIVGTIRTHIKRALHQAEENEFDAAFVSANTAMKAIDSAAAKGVLHKNNAKRRVSRLFNRIKGMQTAAAAE